MIRQGDIHYADLAEAGRRPVLIVSRDALNRGAYVVYVAFTTARLDARRSLPNCVPFRAGEFGLTADCVAQCDTVAPVAVADLDPTPIGSLDPATIRSVIRALGDVFDADCEPACRATNVGTGAARQTPPMPATAPTPDRVLDPIFDVPLTPESAEQVVGHRPPDAVGRRMEAPGERASDGVLTPDGLH